MQAKVLCGQVEDNGVFAQSQNFRQPSGIKQKDDTLLGIGDNGSIYIPAAEHKFPVTVVEQIPMLIVKTDPVGDDQFFLRGEFLQIQGLPGCVSAITNTRQSMYTQD